MFEVEESVHFDTGWVCATCGAKMHGRKKPTREPTAEERAEKAKKLGKYTALSHASFAVCRARSNTPEAFALNTKMVGANPDFYSMWNHRRDMLLGMFEGKSDEDMVQLCKGELQLTQRCIAERNPKSYCAWFHRKWIVNLGHADLNHELELCKKLLMADERNFHCWNYRRFVAKKAGISPQAELDFAKEKILYNFSNYSAWHYRSKLLPQLGALTTSVITAELEFLQDAIFTEPADQSLWMYHRWLLSALAKAHRDSPDTRVAAREVMDTQLQQCVELAEAMESDGESSKWPRLAETFLLRLMASGDAISSGEGGSESGGGEDGSQVAESGGADTTAKFTALAEMDPHHANFYTYAAQARTPMLGDLAAQPPRPLAVSE